MASTAVIINPVTGDQLPTQNAVGAPALAQLGFNVLCATLLGAFAINAPPAPAEGQVWAASDNDGNAAANNITLQGNGNQIDGSATLVLNSNGAFAYLVFDRGQWRRMAARRRIDGSGREIALVADGPAGPAGPAGPTATGTGIPHIVAGTLQPAASLIVNADVDPAAAIALSKIVNPTGSGVVKSVAGVLAAAASLIVDADVNAAAAIAGTKIAPDFGAQTVKTTGNATLGSGVFPGTGLIRTATGPQVIITCRDVGNANDLSLLETALNDFLYLGTNAALTTAKQVEIANLFASNNVQMGVQGNVVFQLNPASIAASQPQIGASVAWGGVNGKSAVNAAGAGNITLAAADLSLRANDFTGARTAIGNVNVPAATDAQAYLTWWKNSTTGGFNLTLTTGAGTTQAIGAGGAWHLFMVNAAGITLMI